MTVTYTSRLGLRKNDDVSPINVSVDFNDLMDTLDGAASFEPRTDFPSNPYDGKGVARTDQTTDFQHGPTYWMWDTTGWVEMLTHGITLAVENETDQTRTGSTAYTEGSSVIEYTFKAPASGRIFVTVAAELEASAGGEAGFSFEIRETDVTGTVHTAASIAREVKRTGANEIQVEYRVLIESLTPFQQYYIRGMHRVDPSTETATIRWRRIQLERA